MAAVDALPMRSQMTFGGAPFTNDRLRKSSSLEITVKSCWRVGPDLQIGRAGQARQVDVRAVGELVSQCANQARAQVLIEQ
jgi:hypothetical protein